MNAFYQQPTFVQWAGAIILLLAGFAPALSLIEKGYAQPLFYLLFLIYIPVGQFASAPFFKLTKIYTYYSPMLLWVTCQTKIRSTYLVAAVSPTCL